jgi:hypothetical protein
MEAKARTSVAMKEDFLLSAMTEGKLLAATVTLWRMGLLLLRVYESAALLLYSLRKSGDLFRIFDFSYLLILRTPNLKSKHFR